MFLMTSYTNHDQSMSLMDTFEINNAPFKALTIHLVQKEIHYDYSIS